MTLHQDSEPTRLLITAGPTHEPIDAVRFIGNRSSGKLGVALADAAANAGWQVRLLLGPTHLRPADAAAAVERFTTAAELGGLLADSQGWCDVLVMAAAVADYRPRTRPGQLGTKLKRLPESISIELEPTEDLLAGCAARRRPGQLLVGFALEPRERLLASAREKLVRKRIDMIVANPLGTMESDSIEAIVLGPGDSERSPGRPVAKGEFAAWLVGVISEVRRGMAGGQRA